MTTPENGAAAPGSESTLLLVDDESNILSSLRRLFRPQGYRVLTAESGKAGLDIMEREKIDLIISDMRMPEMTGAEFLAIVAQRWPHVVRILLTGYADLTSTVDAINKGAIYRYVSKPWEDNDLRLTVQQALEQQNLKKERERLVALVARQNCELKDLNAGLEAKVRARTEEIRQTADMLDLAYQELKRSYREAIPVFANLMEMREGEVAGHGRHVGEIARALAEMMGMEQEAIDTVYFAAVLHDIGKISLPDALLRKPFVSLSAEERRQVIRHPVTGQMALTPLAPLQDAAQLIRHHHERFDGSGYPDKLAGEQIPLGARIIAVANDFDALLRGSLVEGQMSAAEARAFLNKGSGSRYDPRVVELMLQWIDANPAAGRVTEDLRVIYEDLRPGMVLAQDLVSADGILLLSRDHVLDARMIERIAQFEKEQDRGFTIHIKRD